MSGCIKSAAKCGRDEAMQSTLKLYAKSMGKVFPVRHLATSDDDANEFCRKHPDTGVIAEDSDTGVVIIADLYALTVDSSALPD
jgi:hypothetical protein